MVALVACWAVPAAAQNGFDPGGLTFKDFAIADRGASFNRSDPMLSGAPGPAPAHLLTIDNNNGLARLRFDAIKVELSVPLGWQATEESERGVSLSSDRSYRLIVWRLDFAFEGVLNAEQYAATKIGAIRARHPAVQGQARKLGDGSFLIVYQNESPAQGDHERRTVFDVVVTNPGNPKEGVLMTLGVPASQADRGLKLAALLKQNMKIDW